MENANRINRIVLISLVFILAASCLARKPIANYCLDIDENGGFIKFESIADSSIFAKMEERNIWQCKECETQKKYFVKIKNRDNMTCLSDEFIFKEYYFLIKNINLDAFSDSSREGHGLYGFGGCIDCPSEKEPLKNIAYQINATTEFVIDFPDRNITSVKNTSTLNDIKSSFGDTIPVSWEFKIKCSPHNDTIITGSYFIRITGECPK